MAWVNVMNYVVYIYTEYKLRNHYYSLKQKNEDDKDNTGISRFNAV